MKGLLVPALLALALSGCELTDDEKEKLDNAAVDLQQLADQIIITYPAKDSEISNSMVTVRADIPASAQAQEVRLLIDGIEIAKDSDGAPWEIQWPAYYFADGSKHTLLLKTITGEGNEVRNNEQFQVTVKEEANEALSFNAGVEGAQVQDQDTFTIGFSAFPEASSYEIKYDEKTIITTNTEAELTDLDVGIHTIQYRALHNSISNPPYSSTTSIEVLAPMLPTLNAPMVESKDEGYEVTLSWEAISVDDTYEINWGPTGNLTSMGSTSDSNYILSDIELGNYEYTLRRTNSLDQQSAVSEVMPIGIGVFHTQLGGSQNEEPRQIIASKQGGYLISATTNSHDLSESLDGVDDWIIRLNEQGDVLNDLVINASNQTFNKLFEASDGSIYLVGNDEDEKKAIITKLNSELESQWSVFYRPEGEVENYYFKDIIAWNKKLYLCANSNNAAYLHEVNPENGAISGSIPLPIDANIDIRCSKLFVSSSNDLILFGGAEPADKEMIDYFSGGAYILSVNSNWEQVFNWNNVGAAFHVYAGDAIELSNGRFAIVGSGEIGQLTISFINSDGTKHRDFSDSASTLYMGSSLAPNESGGVFAIFRELDGSQLVELNSNASPTSTIYSLNEGHYTYGKGIIKNKDKSLTLLMRVSENETNNWSDIIWDIIVKRIPLEY